MQVCRPPRVGQLTKQSKLSELIWNLIFEHAGRHVKSSHPRLHVFVAGTIIVIRISDQAEIVMSSDLKGNGGFRPIFHYIRRDRNKFLSQRDMDLEDGLGAMAVYIQGR